MLELGLGLFGNGNNLHVDLANVIDKIFSAYSAKSAE
jgi:hypothetical protein